MESSQESTIKKDKFTVLKWISSIILLMAGLGSLTEFTFVSVLNICMALFICPLTYKLIIVDILKKSFDSKTKWGIVILSLVIQLIIISIENANKVAAKKESDDKIVQKINTLIDSNKIQDAIAVINEYKKDNGIENIDTSNAICKIQTDIFNSQDFVYMRNVLLSMSDEDINMLKVNKYKKVYFNQKILNQNFLEYLTQNIKNKKRLQEDLLKESNTTQESSSNWVYNEYIDEMTSSKCKTATIEANELLEFDSPYQGGSIATLLLRKKDGKCDVYLSVTKGQFIPSIDGSSTLRIKFDDKSPKTFSYSMPSDYSYDGIFISSEKNIIENIKKSKKIIIEVEFYNEGLRKIKFNTSDLKF